MRTVHEISRVAPGAITTALERTEPCIVVGAVADWPACAAWDSHGLRERLGDVLTSFKVSPSHKHPDFGAEDLATTFAVEEGTFGELLDSIRQPFPEGARCLLTGSEEFLLRRAGSGELETNPKLALLLDDIDAGFVPMERLRSSWFWISGAGVRTWLHYDNNGCDNANAQVRGSKVVHAFDPDALAALHPFEWGGPNPAHNCCAVDFEAPDLERFPRYAEVEAWTGRVEAGDLLFLPANWIHTFEHTGDLNVNVNFWWPPRTERDSVVARRQSILDEVAKHSSLDEGERAEFARRDRAAIESGAR